MTNTFNYSGTSVVYCNGTIPDNSIGNDKDFCISTNSDTGDSSTYIKNGTAWQLVSAVDVFKFALLNKVANNIIKYNGTDWVSAAIGAGSGVQAWDTDLDTVASLAQGTNKVIISNGTNWTSRKVALATDISDITVTTPGVGQILTYNGTNWVNTTNDVLNLIIDTITGADSVASEPMIFVTDPTRSNKKLSSIENSFLFSNNAVSNDEFLFPSTGITATTTGIILPYPGTIVRITGQTTNSNGKDQKYSILLDSAETVNVLDLGGVSNTLKTKTNTAVNIDFSAGQTLRIQARAGVISGNLNGVTATIWVKWRK